MVINSFVIYLISLADNLSVMFFLFIAACLIGVLIFSVLATEDFSDYEETRVNAKKYRKICLVSSAIFLILMTITPSAKTLIAMYTIPPIVNNKQVQQLPENLLKFANDYLTKEIKKEVK